MYVPICNRFHVIPANNGKMTSVTDRRTDGQTTRRWQRRAKHSAFARKKKEPKVSQNSPFSQTPFPSTHINQTLRAGSYPGYLSWF